MEIAQYGNGYARDNSDPRTAVSNVVVKKFLMENIIKRITKVKARWAFLGVAP